MRELGSLFLQNSNIASFKLKVLCNLLDSLKKVTFIVILRLKILKMFHHLLTKSSVTYNAKLHALNFLFV